MDEPISHLDARLRADMRTELKRLHRRLGVTTLYVTHDQLEAVALADRIAVMHQGVLQQVGTRGRVVRPAGQRVRRRLHRLAADEHAGLRSASLAGRGPRARGRRRGSASGRSARGCRRRRQRGPTGSASARSTSSCAPAGAEATIEGKCSCASAWATMTASCRLRRRQPGRRGPARRSRAPRARRSACSSRPPACTCSRAQRPPAGCVSDAVAHALSSDPRDGRSRHPVAEPSRSAGPWPSITWTSAARTATSSSCWALGRRQDDHA